MGFYSITATSKSTVELINSTAILGKGLNVLTVATEDIDLIKSFLESHEVIVHTIRRLDDFDNLEPASK